MAIPLGVVPTPMAVPATLVATVMGVTVEALELQTYAVVPVGSMATATGWSPTVTVVRMVLAGMEITDTLLEF